MENCCALVAVFVNTALSELTEGQDPLCPSPRQPCDTVTVAHGALRSLGTQTAATVFTALSPGPARGRHLTAVS